MVQMWSKEAKEYLKLFKQKQKFDGVGDGEAEAGEDGADAGGLGDEDDFFFNGLDLEKKGKKGAMKSMKTAMKSMKIAPMKTAMKAAPKASMKTATAKSSKSSAVTSKKGRAESDEEEDEDSEGSSSVDLSCSEDGQDDEVVCPKPKSTEPSKEDKQAAKELRTQNVSDALDRLKSMQKTAGVVTWAALLAMCEHQQHGQDKWGKDPQSLKKQGHKGPCYLH